MAKQTSTERFLAAATELGLDVEVARYPEGSRTAADAARAIGCDVAQIVKSLVFASDGGLVLVLTSGANRVDTVTLAAVHGAPVSRADADQVRAATGYAIGGVPPFGHESRLPVYLDPALLDHAVVWAAAGTPDTVFPIDPHQLERLTGAVVAAFAEPTPGSRS